MKIVIQKRTAILELPRDVWAVVVGPEQKGMIVSSNPTFPHLGEYKNGERAGQVLAEMFDCYQNGKNSYIMPEE